jgi:hypothetical protein
MNLIEITHPAGALDDAARTEVAQQIITGILGVEEIPAETLRRARRMIHVLFHEARGWTTGDGILPEQAPPPFIVTITVPEAWREEMSRHGSVWCGRRSDGLTTGEGSLGRVATCGSTWSASPTAASA